MRRYCWPSGVTVSLVRRADNRSGRPDRLRAHPVSRRIGRFPHSPPRLAGAIFALIVVCSLVASGIGAALFDRSPDDAPPEKAVESEGEEFERSLRDAIASNPNDTEAMVSLANLLSTLGEQTEAVDWYERALAIHPNDVGIRLAFAASLVQFGKLADAEVQYLNVLAMERENAEAHFYLAELYRQWQPPRHGDAALHFRQVIELAPDSYLGQRAEEEMMRLGGVEGTAAASPGVARASGQSDVEKAR